MMQRMGGFNTARAQRIDDWQADSTHATMNAQRNRADSCVKIA
jgi:hypothetical protein